MKKKEYWKSLRNLFFNPIMYAVLFIFLLGFSGSFGNAQISSKKSLNDYSFIESSIANLKFEDPAYDNGLVAFIEKGMLYVSINERAFFVDIESFSKSGAKLKISVKDDSPFLSIYYDSREISLRLIGKEAALYFSRPDPDKIKSKSGIIYFVEHYSPDLPLHDKTRLNGKKRLALVVKESSVELWNSVQAMHDKQGMQGIHAIIEKGSFKISPESFLASTGLKDSEIDIIYRNEETNKNTGSSFGKKDAYNDDKEAADNVVGNNKDNNLGHTNPESDSENDFAKSVYMSENQIIVKASKIIYDSDYDRGFRLENDKFSSELPDSFSEKTQESLGSGSGFGQDSDLEEAFAFGFSDFIGDQLVFQEKNDGQPNTENSEKKIFGNDYLNEGNNKISSNIDSTKEGCEKLGMLFVPGFGYDYIGALSKFTKSKAYAFGIAYSRNDDFGMALQDMADFIEQADKSGLTPVVRIMGNIGSINKECRDYFGINACNDEGSTMCNGKKIINCNKVWEGCNVWQAVDYSCSGNEKVSNCNKGNYCFGKYAYNEIPSSQEVAMFINKLGQKSSLKFVQIWDRPEEKFLPKEYADYLNEIKNRIDPEIKLITGVISDEVFFKEFSELSNKADYYALSDSFLSNELKLNLDTINKAGLKKKIFFEAGLGYGSPDQIKPMLSNLISMPETAGIIIGPANYWNRFEKEKFYEEMPLIDEKTKQIGPFLADISESLCNHK